MLDSPDKSLEECVCGVCVCVCVCVCVACVCCYKGEQNYTNLRCQIKCYYSI